MATSGTTAFAPDFTEIAEEAWEQAGREMRSGYDLRTARRAFNLLTLDWQNRGINLWTIDEASVSLVAGTVSYNLAADTVSVLDAVIRLNDGNTSTQQDYTISRISASEYSALPNKLATGRPVNMWVDRQLAQPTVYLWPVPGSSNYKLYYWRMRRIEDAGNGAETPDVPFRFVPALIAGLAYEIAVKTPDLLPRVQLLKARYEELFDRAAEEDRVKTPFRLTPRIGGY